MTFPDALRSVLERCLADDPAARPTAQEVLISLVNPNDAGTSPQAPKRSWLLPVAAAIAVALVSAATVAAWPDGQKAAGSPEPSPAPTIAAEFTGRWAGTVAEKQSKELLVVDLDLVPSHGTLSTARCVQRLDLRKSTATEVVLAGARSEKCDEIELTLSLRQGRLRYRSQNSSGTIAYEEELLRF